MPVNEAEAQKRRQDNGALLQEVSTMELDDAHIRKRSGRIDAMKKTRPDRQFTHRALTGA